MSEKIFYQKKRMNCRMKRLNYLLCSALALPMTNVFADDVETLDTVDVTASAPEEVQNKKVGETVKTAKTLEKQQVSDTRDLVKYETGVSVVEKGRMGSSGYAIRGVDENRVNITIDGLQQAQTISSPGFKELFEGYGNFNNTRNGVEVETIKEVNIGKGADSTKVGSGALGGSVIFETKDARDYLLDKDWFYKGKLGYSSANNEKMMSHTFAGRYKDFDALLVRTDRKGNNLENFGYDEFDDNAQGRSRQKADPYGIKKYSTLLKVGYNLNETNRFTLMLDDGKTTSKGHDWSYTLAPTRIQPDLLETDSRHTNDSSSRRNIALSFENYDANPFWDSAKVTLSSQEITQTAQTEDYCDGGENCDSYKNPAGLELKDGQWVDSHGGKVDFMRGSNNPNDSSTLTRLVDSQGKEYISYQSTNDFWFDCSKVDCSKGVDVFNALSMNSKGDKAQWEHQELSQKKSYRGKEYATWEGNYSIPLPPSTGFSESSYKKRDLVSETKSFHFDLEKSVDIKETEHNFKYGLAYANAKKSMKNVEYYRVVPNEKVTWWANAFSNDDVCDTSNVLACEPSKDSLKPTSFLIPVKTTKGALYLADDMRINDWMRFDLGYRYDSVAYKPEYIVGKTPKIPDDMVRNLLIDKTPAENIEYLASKRPKFTHHSYSLGATIDPTDYLKVQAKYSNGFRAPTSDEMFFTFRHPDFTIFPNVDLKPETADTKELAFTLYKNRSYLTLSAFRTDYKDFIDLDYLGVKKFKVGNNGGEKGFSTYQNRNQQKAQVTGFEVDSKLFLEELTPKLQGFNIGYKYTHQKGKIKGENGYHPMNAIQPDKQVLSLGYVSADKDYGVDLYWTHVAEKKMKDTYNQFYIDGESPFAKYRSGSFNILDLVGFYKPVEGLTIRAGVYNLLNKNYMTWENARSIRSFGTSNMICQDGDIKSLGCNYARQGIERFHSPERNYKVSLEYQF